MFPPSSLPLEGQGTLREPLFGFFRTLLFPRRDVPRFVPLCCAAACRGGEKPSPAERCGFILMGTVCSAPAKPHHCSFARSGWDNAEERSVLSSRACPFAQNPGKGSWIPREKRGADLAACGDTWQHCRAREEGAEGTRGGHCPVPPSQAGRSPRHCRFGPSPGAGPATAAGEAGGAAL